MKNGFWVWWERKISFLLVMIFKFGKLVCAYGKVCAKESRSRGVYLCWNAFSLVFPVLKDSWLSCLTDLLRLFSHHTFSVVVHISWMIWLPWQRICLLFIMRLGVLGCYSYSTPVINQMKLVGSCWFIFFHLLWKLLSFSCYLLALAIHWMFWTYCR